MSAPSSISFTLNGQRAEAQKDETVLKVAHRLGLNIPALCHHEAIVPYGACRLCIVEVSTGPRSRLVTSCVYCPAENDRVETDTERVRRVRRMVLELLLGRCPEVEAIRRLAREYGVNAARFHPPAGLPANERCILCGLCVRVCAEAIGQHAIGYANRGMERKVSAPFGSESEACIGCGSCVYVCPTGALHFEDAEGQRIMKELDTRLPLATCKVCGGAFTTEKLVRKVKERMPLVRDLVETCPSCRATRFRGTVELNLAMTQPSNFGAGTFQGAREGGLAANRPSPIYRKPDQEE